MPQDGGATPPASLDELHKIFSREMRGSLDQMQIVNGRHPHRPAL